MLLIIVVAFSLWTWGYVLTPATAARSATLGDLSSSRQLIYLLTHPFSIPAIAISTISTYWYFYISTAIGVFGWLELWMSQWAYILIGGTFFIVSFSAMSERKACIPNAAFGISATIGASLTFGALYLTWIPVFGSHLVTGVQGRYFIPLLFPAFLSITSILKERNMKLAIHYFNGCSLVCSVLSRDYAAGRKVLYCINK